MAINSAIKEKKESLIRMQDVKGTPNLVDYQDDRCVLVMSRLPGSMPETLSEDNLLKLIDIVNQMIASGVARHSMPIRDVLVSDSGEVSLVDFERSTLRSSFWRLDWYIAIKVTHYHLYRLIYQFAPHLLTPTSKKTKVH